MADSPEYSLLPDALIEALQLLAAPAEAQARVLPDFVAKPDEVLLSYLDAWEITDVSSVDARLGRDLVELADAIQALPIESEEYFDAVALGGSEFTSLRRTATAILDSMGLPTREPDLSDVQYVEGKGSRRKRD